MVKVEKNTSNHDRGLHIVLINPKNGEILKAKVFDTYKSSSEFEAFIDSPNVPAGCILVAACKDDCVTNLSQKAKAWFAKMGSKEIWNLEYRQGFAFIGTTDQETACSEQRGNFQKDTVQVTQCFKMA